MKQKYKLSPTTGSLGAILEGIDLTLLDKETLSLLVKALDQFLVIQIPNQNLDRFQLSKL